MKRRNTRKTTQEFIEEATATHGNKYDYSLSEYITNRIKVKIICPVHGVFEQNPSLHISGAGCQKCWFAIISKNRILTTEDFIKRSNLSHKNKYDYSLVIYTGARDKVEIICKEHGVFLATPCYHMRGTGCSTCADESNAELKRSDKEGFVAKAEALYPGRFDYNLVDYSYSNVKVTIVCPEHGEFRIRPNDFLMGHSCPKCSTRGFNPVNNGWVYLLKSDNLYKVGITHKGVSNRLAQINKSSNERFEVLFSKIMRGETAQKVENSLLGWLKTNHRQPTTKFDGYTESFIINNTSAATIVDKLLEFEKEVIN